MDLARYLSFGLKVQKTFELLVSTNSFKIYCKNEL